MSTDTPNAWGKNPPFDNPIEDIWDNAVGDTVETMKKDLLGIIHCAVEEEVEFYMPCDDYIMDNADDFKEEVAQTLIKDFSLTDKLMAENRKMLRLIREIDRSIHETDTEKYTDGEIIDIVSKLITETLINKKNHA